MVNCANEVSRSVKGITVTQLANQFQSAAQSHFSGKLDFLAANERQWSLYFRLGRLIWTAGSEHRFRRWHRLMKQFCPTIHPNAIHPNAIQLKEKELPFYWEYLVLSVLLKRQHVRREPVISLIQTAALEVLFDLLHASEQITQISYAPDKQEQFGDPLAPLSAEQVLEQVRQSWNEWNSAGLVHYSPNAVPVIKRPADLKRAVSTKTYQTLEALMRGDLTLRDLARATGQDLLTLTRVLVPHIQRDLIELCQMPDILPPGFSESETVKVAAPNAPAIPNAPAASPAANAPLVVCIDDSPSVCKWMEQIITSAGYRYISVQDSVHALPLLLESKPGLIFLDLVMPIASGYEICSQIRRMSAFKNTPVVILTGNDGIVDRVRAKVVGASDFLSKPVNAEKVLAIARQYLPIPMNATATDRTISVESPTFLGNTYEMGETTALLLQKGMSETSAIP